MTGLYFEKDISCLALMYHFPLRIQSFSDLFYLSNFKNSSTKEANIIVSIQYKQLVLQDKLRHDREDTFASACSQPGGWTHHD